ncbi:MAG: hypothetical protein ABUK01_16680 [Leptospirales bacterium]
MKLKKIEIGINDGVFFGNEKRHKNHNRDQRDKKENKSKVIWMDRVHSKAPGKSFEQMLLDEFKGVTASISTSKEDGNKSSVSNAQKAANFLTEYWA